MVVADLLEAWIRDANSSSGQTAAAIERHLFPAKLLSVPFASATAFFGAFSALGGQSRAVTGKKGSISTWPTTVEPVS